MSQYINEVSKSMYISTNMLLLLKTFKIVKMKSS